MNLKNNKKFRRIVFCVFDVLSNIKSSLLSLGYIAALSSWRVARNSKKVLRKLKTSDVCCVLGNGPSLKEAIANDEVPYNNADVMCVNMFCLDDAFWIIKPRYYYIADPAMFMPKNQQHKEMADLLINRLLKVNWELLFVIGPQTPRCVLLDEINNNKNIKIININTTQVSGFKWFRHFFYRHCFGMPRCQTVVNVALTSAINIGYKTIYLYGADHSWTRDLRVDDNNVVCYGDRHVYNTNLQVIKKEENIGFLLEAFANMFKSHYLIEEYALSRGIKIWNCTKESFIDAYERLNANCINGH